MAKKNNQNNAQNKNGNNAKNARNQDPAPQQTNVERQNTQTQGKKK